MSGADRALLERILEEARVDTRVEPPGWADWLRDAVPALVERLATGLGRRFPSLPPGLAPLFGWLLVALLAIAIALVVTRSLRALLATRHAPAPANPTASLSQPPAPAVDWRTEARLRLAAGRLEEALQAAWWWFATSICPGPVDGSWTTREVLARARRHDLSPLGSQLDVWMYGKRRPAGSDVAALLQSIEGAIA